MNIIFLIGVAIFLGTISGKIFQRMKIPQVVGYILLGLLIGKSFFHLLEGKVVESLTPLVNFTLGIIGCVIGAELKGADFKKYGRSIYTILCAEGLVAFFAVAAIVTLLTKKLYLGLILGAIASATDPASTINVLWEYKAKGPLTRTLTAVIALDDGLALILYGLVSVFSKSMILQQTFSWWDGLGVPLLEIAECVGLGVICAVVVSRVINYIKEESLVIAFILGVVAAGVGLSMYLNLDLILSSMAFGTAMANIAPRISEKIFGTIKEMATSLYILFFVAIGAQLDIHSFFNVAIISIVVAYLLARSLGKIFGAMAGGWMVKAQKTVTKYTGLCLFAQGGVAMGLALSISHNLSHAGPEGQKVGLLVINIIVATTFIVQVIGPPLVKLGITKADERGRNVTRDDIIESLKVEDVMSREFPSIPVGAALHDVIDVVKEEEGFNYPVVDGSGRLQGVITIKELKDALFESELDGIILAGDIAVPTHFILHQDDPLGKAFEMFNNRNLEFIPVVENNGAHRVVGVLESRDANQEVERRLLERHQLG